MYIFLGQSIWSIDFCYYMQLINNLSASQILFDLGEKDYCVEMLQRRIAQLPSQLGLTIRVEPMLDLVTAFFNFTTICFYTKLYIIYLTWNFHISMNTRNIKFWFCFFYSVLGLSRQRHYYMFPIIILSNICFQNN